MLPEVIYQDESILVINKPAGITVNKADTTRHEQTVQEWIESKLSTFNFQFSNDKESDFFKRAGIVHRLDKETSGVLIVAKTSESFVELQRQFKERIVKKTYIALVHGEVLPEEGTINVPVGRLPWSRERFGILPGGRESVTHYKALSSKYLELGKKKLQLTLLELYPKTGRTHQIRVHMKYFMHPIFSDFLYGGRKQARDDRKLLPRVFLHAKNISFVHPQTGKEVFFESSLPEELQNVLQKLA